jgi:hypothetical protein
VGTEHHLQPIHPTPMRLPTTNQNKRPQVEQHQLPTVLLLSAMQSRTHPYHGKTLSHIHKQNKLTHRHITKCHKLRTPAAGKKAAAASFAWFAGLHWQVMLRMHAGTTNGCVLCCLCILLQRLISTATSQHTFAINAVCACPCRCHKSAVCKQHCASLWRALHSDQRNTCTEQPRHALKLSGCCTPCHDALLHLHGQATLSWQNTSTWDAM